MHLSVYSNSKGQLLVSLLHAENEYKMMWVVPMLAENDEILSAINERTLIPVGFKNAQYKIPFLHLRTIRDGGESLKEVGNLDNEDSINIMNHILDMLRWD